MAKPVRGSKTGRPIMALLDLLGRRWVLRIVWELRDEPRRGASIEQTARLQLLDAEALGRLDKPN